MQMVYAQNNATVSRFAVVVSTRVDKRATVRNRIKRLVRESIHHLLPIIAVGWDVIVFARQDLSNRKQQDVEIAIKKLFERARLIAPLNPKGSSVPLSGTDTALCAAPSIKIRVKLSVDAA